MNVYPDLNAKRISFLKKALFWQCGEFQIFSSHFMVESSTQLASSLTSLVPAWDLRQSKEDCLNCLKMGSESRSGAGLVQPFFCWSRGQEYKVYLEPLFRFFQKIKLKINWIQTKINSHYLRNKIFTNVGLYLNFPIITQSIRHITLTVKVLNQRQEIYFMMTKFICMQLW